MHTDVAETTTSDRPTPAALVPLASAVARRPALLSPLAAAHAALVVATSGRLFGRWFGLPVLVLETVGRRSGVRRSTPLVYLRDGPNLVVVAANGGADRPPHWWLNLGADAHAVAVTGRHRVPVLAVEPDGARRRHLWRRLAARLPVEEYQRRTERPLPVVVLAPDRAPTRETTPRAGDPAGGRGRRGSGVVVERSRGRR